MPRRLGGREIAAIAAVMLLLTTVIVAIYALTLKQANDQRWVEHTLDVQVRLARVSSLLQDAETAQRGYLITENPRFYDAFQAATAPLAAEMDALQALVMDNPPQVEAVGMLRTASANRMRFLGTAVDLQKNGSPDDARALIKTGKGKALMDEGTDIIQRIFDAEQILLGQRKEVSSRTALWTQLTVGLAFVLAALAGLFVLLGSRRQIADLQRVNAALQDAAVRRENLESQLRQAQKMEAVGQLTGGIAHDFNNMLAIIIGSLDMTIRKLTRGDTNVSRFVENAMDGAQRAATLTHRLLAFSRQQPLAPEVTELHSLVNGMAEMMRRTLGENVRLETVHGGGLWKVAVDKGQLEQAILNLAVNSRDALEGEGRLTIETYNASLDDAYAQNHIDVPAGQYVVVAVSDSGKGMTPEVKARAFDPFFTTKEVGKGTGLGLSQVFGFVSQSGGHVNIYSEVGHGTTVKIYLPRYVGPQVSQAPSEDPQRMAAPTGQSGELVLVVEDEDKVRHMVVDTLRDLGYTVAHASNGRDALALVDRVGAIKLLFTDIVMPDMNGRILADAVHERLPDAKILYTTGYTRNAVIHDGKLDANVNLLSKPFTVGQLASKVRSVIDKT